VNGTLVPAACTPRSTRPFRGPNLQTTHRTPVRCSRGWSLTQYRHTRDVGQRSGTSRIAQPRPESVPVGKAPRPEVPLSVTTQTCPTQWPALRSSPRLPCSRRFPACESGGIAPRRGLSEPFPTDFAERSRNPAGMGSLHERLAAPGQVRRRTQNDTPQAPPGHRDIASVKSRKNGRAGKCRDKKGVNRYTEFAFLGPAIGLRSPKLVRVHATFAC